MSSSLNVANNGYFGAILQWNERWAHREDYGLALYDSVGTSLAAVPDTQAGAGTRMRSSRTRTSPALQDRLPAVYRWADRPPQAPALHTWSGVTREYNVVAGSVTPNHHTTASSPARASTLLTRERYDRDLQLAGSVEHYFPAYELRSKPDITGIDGVSVTARVASPRHSLARRPRRHNIAALLPGAQRQSRRHHGPGVLVHRQWGNRSRQRGADNTFGHGRADALNAVYNAMGGTPTRTVDQDKLAHHHAHAHAHCHAHTDSYRDAHIHADAYADDHAYPTRTATADEHSNALRAPPTSTRTPTRQQRAALHRVDPASLPFLTSSLPGASARCVSVTNSSAIPFNWTPVRVSWLTNLAHNGTSVRRIAGEVHCLY